MEDTETAEEDSGNNGNEKATASAQLHPNDPCRTMKQEDIPPPPPLPLFPMESLHTFKRDTSDGKYNEHKDTTTGDHGSQSKRAKMDVKNAFQEEDNRFPRMTDKDVGFVKDTCAELPPSRNEFTDRPGDHFPFVSHSSSSVSPPAAPHLLLATSGCCQNLKIRKRENLPVPPVQNRINPHSFSQGNDGQNSERRPWNSYSYSGDSGSTEVSKTYGRSTHGYFDSSVHMNEPDTYSTRFLEAPDETFDAPLVFGRLEEDIVAFISEFKRPVSSREIVRQFAKHTDQELNPILYSLRDRNILAKVTWRPPSWKVVQNSSDHERHTLPKAYSPPNTDASRGHRNILPAMTVNKPPQNIINKVNNPSSTPRESRFIDEKKTSMTSRMLEGHSSGSPSTLRHPVDDKKHHALSDVAFSTLTKNPVSTLNEYAQKRGLELSFEILHEGKSSKNKFLMCVKIGEQLYPAVSGSNMKDTRRDAADAALRMILGELTVEPSTQAATKESLHGLSHFDRIANLSHMTFLRLSARTAEKFAGRKVIAAIIMKTGVEDEGKVISLGTGNRCITGERMSLEGKMVNDSHAEIVCRRAFVRFLCGEILNFYEDKHSIFVKSSLSNKLEVKDDVSFHLYISTAPCGDGALFTPRTDVENAAGQSQDRSHCPTFSSKKQGVLRTKVEDGEGTIPIDFSEGPQTWDGILRGCRLRTMSCSDKVCRWNVLGLQGGILSHIIDPVYLDSLTLGYLYDHGHLSRAICCRLNQKDDFDSSLPLPYYLNHPWIGRVTAYSPPRDTEKTNHLSINWTLGDADIEVTDGRIGACLKRTATAPMPSRLCKAALFRSFKEICSKVESLKHLLSFETYADAKEGASNFQRAKSVMFDQFMKCKYGSWVRKPREQEYFSV